MKTLLVSVPPSSTTTEVTVPVLELTDILIKPGTVPVNQVPAVDIGSNRVIKLPVNQVALNAVAYDPDGKIVAYLWSITGSGSLPVYDQPGINVTDLKEGTTIVRCTVYDDKGATNKAEISIIVQAADVVMPPSNYGSLVYSSGFETQKELDPYGNGQLGSGSLSSLIKRSGLYSFKSVPKGGVSSGIRSEIQYPSSLTPTEGVIEVDALYETIFQNSGHSMQFHPNTSGGSASPGLWHENGKFVWVNWKGGDNTKYPTNYTIPRNKWMHMVFEYKIGSNGYMKFTIDGIVILNKTGIQVGDGSGQFFKLGVNMWVDQASVVYYDNLKIWKKTA